MQKKESTENLFISNRYAAEVYALTTLIFLYSDKRKVLKHGAVGSLTRPIKHLSLGMYPSYGSVDDRL